MNYPLISEYIEAIKSAEDNFKELSYLRPVLGDDGLPVMTGGNFAVVFKMKDEQDGKIYAVKCFTREQEGRAEAYREIAKELKDVSSSYLVSIRYLEKELFVDTNQTTETEFPILLMEWVEGKTLDKYLRENLDDKYALEMLAYRFSQLAQWLIPQPFAHGDLKPDNILVREDGTLVLVDYDGMYVPSMKGQNAREIGSPDFCHPQRTEEVFNEHIDDFPVLSILLSLCIVFVNSDYLSRYGAEDRLLFSKNDYIDIYSSTIFNEIPSIIEKETNYKSLFEKMCGDVNFHLGHESLTPVNKLLEAIALETAKINAIVRKMSMELMDFSRIELYKLAEGTNGLNNSKRDCRKFVDEQIKQPSCEKGKLLSKKTFRDYLKSKDSSKWQAALLLHILTVVVTYLIYYTNESFDVDAKWDYVGFGFGIGFIAWLFYSFDYIKRNGSYGNCLIAFILYPITFYYGIYWCINKCINAWKEYVIKQN